MASQNVKWTGLSRLIFHCFLTLLVLRVTAQECSLRFVNAARLSSRVCRSRVGKRVLMLDFMSLSSSRVAASARFIGRPRGESELHGVARGVALLSLVACSPMLAYFMSSPLLVYFACSSNWRGVAWRVAAGSWHRGSGRQSASCAVITFTITRAR